MTTDYKLNTPDGYNIDITTYELEDNSDKNCLIFVHGFKGFKNWGFFPPAAEYFANKGYFVITFNFSFNGIGEDKQSFTELDNFEKNNYSREISELNQIIDAYRNNYFGNGGKGKIGVIGHSRGGGVTILTINDRKDIHAAAVWSSIAYVDRYSDRQKKEWRKKGVFEIKNSRTGQVMPLGIELLNDIEKNKDNKLNILKAVNEIKGPLLICHGEQDMAVPVKEAEEIYASSDKSKSELFIIPSAGHTFNVVHPFEGKTKQFSSLLEKTSEFFNKHFNV